MATHKRVELSTQPVWDLLKEIESVVTDVHMTQLDEGPFRLRVEDGRDIDNDATKAKLARDLLRAAELAGLLSGELHVLYWQLKGQDDPREEG